MFLYTSWSVVSPSNPEISLTPAEHRKDFPDTHMLLIVVQFDKECPGNFRGFTKTKQGLYQTQSPSVLQQYIVQHTLVSKAKVSTGQN